MTNFRPKTKSPLKYLFDEVISANLNRDISQRQFLDYIKHTGISQATFFNDKKIPIESDKSIPEYRLQVYAKALGVEISDLLNYEVQQRPINEVHAEAIRLKKRDGLIAKSFSLEK